MKKFTVPYSSSLKDFTAAVYPQGSFYLSALLRQGDVRVNGEKVRADVQLSCGDEVTYYTTAKQEAKPSHTVVYCDKKVIICDKFSGVSFEGLLSELSQNGEIFGVHRLDRNTCGLIVFAKTKAAEEELINAFRQRTIKKTYYCIAKNNFKDMSATLKAYLKKDAARSLVQVSAKPLRDGAEIITEYSVVETRGELAKVKIILHTGKTHQIRAHLAFIGCPVLGDEKYGDGSLNKKYSARRQYLCAYSLEFGLSGELSYLNGMSFSSSLAPEFP